MWRCYLFGWFRPYTWCRTIGILATIAAISLASAAFASELEINVETRPENQDFGTVYVAGLDRKLLAQLREDTPDAYGWRRMFTVRLQSQSAELNSEDLPNIAGRYEILETGIRFTPQFAPMRGLSYEVNLKFDGYQPAFGVFALEGAAPPIYAKAKIEEIYPTVKSLPENTLRLYVHFSRPMQRGQVAEKIRLLDESGEVVPKAFIVEPLGELWDRDQRRLTLLFDPGRIKRGVGPNRELGPALEAGGQRTLVVDGTFLDATGRTIDAEYLRTYEIDDAIREAVTPERWIIDAPASGTHEPLRLRFARALDNGVLLRAIRVIDTKGQEVEGHVAVAVGEAEWAFTPTVPWSDEGYKVRVAKVLEDVSGNNVMAPMDVTISDTFASSTMRSANGPTEIGFTPITSGN